MERNKEQCKHEISILAENLFTKIKIYREFGLDEKEEEEIRKFVEECSQKYSQFTKQEIKDIVTSVLKRTCNNLKKNKEDDDAR